MAAVHAGLAFLPVFANIASSLRRSAPKIAPPPTFDMDLNQNRRMMRSDRPTVPAIRVLAGRKHWTAASDAEPAATPAAAAPPAPPAARRRRGWGAPPPTLAPPPPAPPFCRDACDGVDVAALV